MSSARSFRSAWLTAVVVGVFAFGCAAGSESTEDLPPPPVDGGGGDTSVTPEDSSGLDTGSDVSTDTADADTGCKTNLDCESDPAGKFCLTSGDGGKSYCVPCLPAPFDECGPGTFCSDTTYTCEEGCKTTADCKPSSGGDGGTDAGDPDADADEVGSDGGASLVCDSVKHRCVGCVADPDCPAGFLCDRPSGACVPGCNTMKPCAAGKECCSGSCFDTQKDTKNCGSCGNVCPTPANGTAGCSAGVCGIGMCNTGYADCNTTASDGCEVNTGSDKNNCGGCGTVCALANATAACTSGACTIATCNGGFDDCDKIASTGCEVDLKTDTNCGVCGRLCTIPNGSGSCSTGTCLISACNTGYGDCNGLPADGCETNTAGGTPGPTGTILNCGTCGTSCSVANGTPACVAGACSVLSCTAPYANCNGLYADGCESNTVIDVNNCGGCGNACNRTNGTASCSASTCSVACNPGFGNCDGLASNGCEKDLRNDKDNCNACGAACLNTANVLSSVCTPTSPSTGACAVGTCAPDTFDRDLVFSNGCECTADTVGNSCVAARDLGTINIGASTSVTGNLVGPGDMDEDWYKITFQTGATCSYTPSVSISGSPSGSVKMQVFTSCAGTAGGSFTCNASGDATSSIAQLDAWEFTFPAGTCGEALTRDPTPATGAFITVPNTIWVRVVRATSVAGCYPYTLTIGN